MKYKIVWSAFSEKQIDDIFNYYTQKATYKLALDIVTKILLAPEYFNRQSKNRTKRTHFTTQINYLSLYFSFEL